MYFAGSWNFSFAGMASSREPAADVKICAVHGSSSCVRRLSVRFMYQLNHSWGGTSLIQPCFCLSVLGAATLFFGASDAQVLM